MQCTSALPCFCAGSEKVQALRAGKHVLCEKPMAMNEAEAGTMLEAGDESGKRFGVSYYRRCYPKVQKGERTHCGGGDRQTGVRRTH